MSQAVSITGGGLTFDHFLVRARECSRLIQWFRFSLQGKFLCMALTPVSAS